MKKHMSSLINKALLVCLVTDLLSMTAHAANTNNCIQLVLTEKYDEVAPICLNACNHNDGDGCTGSGLLFFVMQQYSDAKYYYEKACNLNSGLRCSSLGVLYYYGYGVKQDRNSEQANRILALLGDKYQKTYGG